MFQCDVWLQSREQYKAHVTSAHAHSDEANKLLAADATPYVCEVCGQMFKVRLCHRVTISGHRRRGLAEGEQRVARCPLRTELKSTVRCVPSAPQIALSTIACQGRENRSNEIPRTWQAPIEVENCLPLQPERVFFFFLDVWKIIQ